MSFLCVSVAIVLAFILRLFISVRFVRDLWMHMAFHRIRGRLGSISMLSRNVGMLICFIIGSTLDYHYTPCVFVLIPIVSSIIFVTLPNTPQYYLQRNQLKVMKKKTYMDYGRHTICIYDVMFTFRRKLRMR